MKLHASEVGEGPSLVLLHGLFGAGPNLSVVQRRLGDRFRTLALDLRNHGESPHDPAMGYDAMAADVLETLAARDALPAAILGHSMGGKVAMHAALAQPEALTRLIVADIAPVAYPPHFRAIAEAMRALPLPAGLTRAAADRALADAVPDAALRGFLLRNLRVGDAPAWRIGLAEIAAALPEIEGWETPPGATYTGATYAGPTLFVAGARSDYIRPEHRPAIRALFPRARFATVKAAGHWLHADNPDGFVAVVEGFLVEGFLAG